MAAEIKNAVGVESELIAGGGGIFDIEVDGNMVFRKFDTGRFPNEGEAAQLVQG